MTMKRHDLIFSWLITGMTKKHDLFFSWLIIGMTKKRNFSDDPGSDFGWSPLHHLQFMAVLMLQSSDCRCFQPGYCDGNFVYSYTEGTILAENTVLVCIGTNHVLTIT